MHRKANLVWRLSDDLDADRGRLGGSLAGIAAVGKCCGDERERAPRQAQDHTGTIPVLNVRRLGLQDQTASVSIDHHLALAAFDLLARIIASWAAALGGLHAFADKNGGGARGL